MADRLFDLIAAGHGHQLVDDHQVLDASPIRRLADRVYYAACRCGWDHTGDVDPYGTGPDDWWADHVVTAVAIANCTPRSAIEGNPQ